MPKTRIPATIVAEKREDGDFDIIALVKDMNGAVIKEVKLAADRSPATTITGEEKLFVGPGEDAKTETAAAEMDKSPQGQGVSSAKVGE